MTRRELFCQLCDATTALEHVAYSVAEDQVREALSAIVMRLDEIIDDVQAPRMGRHPRPALRQQT